MDTELTEEEITKTRKISNGIDMEYLSHLTGCKYPDNLCHTGTGYCGPCIEYMKRKE